MQIPHTLGLVKRMAFRFLTFVGISVVLVACAGGSSSADGVAPSSAASSVSVSSSTSSATVSSSASSSMSSSAVSSASASSSSASSTSSSVSSSPNVMPGTVAAPTGAPSTVLVNGLGTVLDTLSRTPKHGVPATWGTFPAALNGKPSIPNVVVLNRADALILYLPAIQGAGDYRAYIYDPSKVTINSNGQPRGAVIACAGFRQRYWRGIDALNSGGMGWFATLHRELNQAIEVPGLVNNGTYQVVVEATSTPCPFPGVMAHTNATVPIDGGAWVGTTYSYRSFADVLSLYGNEILNGQGSAAPDFRAYQLVGTNTYFPAGPVAQGVAPSSTTIPADPTVIARSLITVARPAADEAANAPIFDVGTNAIFDNFSTNSVMTSFHPEERNAGAGLYSGGQFGDWYFWMASVQQAIDGNGIADTGTNPKGAQVWTRHGRLYNTFGDWKQDVMASMYFTSTKTRPLVLDTTQYVHSFFRVDSGATNRRYWHWLMCGAATQSALVNLSTGIPLTRPIAQPFFFEPQANGQGGENPTAAMYGEADGPQHNLECLNLIQVGGANQNVQGKPAGATTTWFDESHSALHAFISPAGRAVGVINLKPAGINDGDSAAAGGMFWRLNASKQPTQPMFEPFDQPAPLAHFDVFVRPDRVIFYINGRQAWCGDLSDRKLDMKYGFISYGSVIYHSTAEVTESYFSPAAPDPRVGAVGGTFHYLLNTPWSDTRVWDAVGHSEKIDIPTQFTFDAATCFKPASTNIR